MDVVLLALRLFGVALAVFLLPGLALLVRARVRARVEEYLVLAFVISYAWLFILSALIPLAGWSIDAAAALTLAFTGLLLWSPPRAPGIPGGVLPRPSWAGAAIVLVMLGLAATAWFIEPSITGEEAIDLASIQRVADGGPVTFENASLLPETRPVYVFQPYQLSMGMIARWSGTDPLVALVKIRPVFVFLSLLFVYALLIGLAPEECYAQAAFAVVVTFIVLDVGVQELNSRFPLVRRGAFSAGVLIPAFMTLALMAVRRIGNRGDIGRRWIALGTAPLALLALLSTHPLEVATLLGFVAVMIGVVLSGFGRWGDRRAAVLLGMICVVTTAGYLAVQSHMVPAVAAEERAVKTAARAAFLERSPEVSAMLFGEMAEEGHDVLAGDVPDSISGVLAVPALLLVACLWPWAAVVLTLGLIPLALIYASPGGLLLASLATSPDTVQDVGAYFALIGLLAVSLGLSAVAHGLLAGGARIVALAGGRVTGGRVIGSIVAAGLVAAALGTTWSRGPRAVDWLLDFVRRHPAEAALGAAVLAVPIFAVSAWRSGKPLAAPPLASFAMFLAAALAAPLVLGGRPASDRVTLSTALDASVSRPTVLDSEPYHAVLQSTIRPPLSVPFSVVEGLRKHLPPRQVLLANPRDSCSLAALVDAYCVNPEAIYGHYFLTARSYHARYVYSSADQDGDWHPFFNSTWPPQDREPNLLVEYNIGHILADPGHAELIDRKLHALQVPTTVTLRQDGYVLYRIDGARPATQEDAD